MTINPQLCIGLLNMQSMYIDNDLLDNLLSQIMERFDKLDKMLDRMNRLKECVGGDTLLDNHDMCALLGITKRTLARYRQRKVVRYYMIEGKAYYKASEIEEFLQSKGKSIK